MYLEYHRGDNFGDALNPIIFNHLLPNNFDNDTSEIFVGIGTILGLKKGYTNTRKIIVFSSGATSESIETYGSVPTMDDRYDIFCVRGPLTAKLLGIEESLAIADGALLSKYVFAKSDYLKKKYEFSYMPHVGSLGFFGGWNELLANVGVHLIDPSITPKTIIKEINETRVLITEALHGAIIADTFRIPWIPVKGYKTINSFKWNDYCEAMGINYSPILLPSLYDYSFINKYFQVKFSLNVNKYICRALEIVRDELLFKRNSFLKSIERIKSIDPYLSKDSVLCEKVELLLEKLHSFKERYR